MFGFRKGRDVSRGDLEVLRAEFHAELSKQASVIRQLETELASVHDQVQKWFRRAVRAEREERKEPREAGAPNQEHLALPDATPVAPAPRPWGARARIAARRERAAARTTANGSGADVEGAEVEE